MKLDIDPYLSNSSQLSNSSFTFTAPFFPFFYEANKVWLAQMVILKINLGHKTRIIVLSRQKPHKSRSDPELYWCEWVHGLVAVCNISAHSLRPSVKVKLIKSLRWAGKPQTSRNKVRLCMKGSTKDSGKWHVHRGGTFNRNIRLSRRTLSDAHLNRSKDTIALNL